MKVAVIMPAYNAEKTLAQSIDDLPFDYIDEVILVDDASKDQTVLLAETIGANHSRLTLSEDEYREGNQKVLFRIFRLEHNIGYGGNQKRCYEIALNHRADIVVMLHPDYQYDPKLIKHFVELIRDNIFDVVLGSRIRSRREALRGGMPRYKYFANRFLSFIQNVASGLSLSEWHTGMRGYKKEVLQNINYKAFSNDFIFDTQMLFAIVEKDYSIGDIPVPVRYFKEASSINLLRSLKYGTLTLLETFKFLLRKYLYKKSSR